MSELVFKQLDKAFGFNRLYQGFDWHLAAGKHCLVGQNGCGKTTLLMMAAGVEPIDGGSICFNNIDVFSLEAKSLLGLSSDKVQLPSFLTAKQLIEFQCKTFNCQWPEVLIERLNFADYLRTLAPQLSLGNQKKLSLILAFCHQPQCLLLDEPLTGLDAVAREVVLELMLEFNGVLVITSHDKQLKQHPQFTIYALDELQ